MKTYSHVEGAKGAGITVGRGLTALAVIASERIERSDCSEYPVTMECHALRDAHRCDGHSDKREDSSGNGGETHCVLFCKK